MAGQKPETIEFWSHWVHPPNLHAFRRYCGGLPLPVIHHLTKRSPQASCQCNFGDAPFMARPASSAASSALKISSKLRSSAIAKTFGRQSLSIFRCASASSPMATIRSRSTMATFLVSLSFVSNALPTSRFQVSGLCRKSDPDSGRLMTANRTPRCPAFAAYVRTAAANGSPNTLGTGGA